MRKIRIREKKKFLIRMLILFFVATLSSSGFFAYQNSNKKNVQALQASKVAVADTKAETDNEDKKAKKEAEDAKAKEAQANPTPSSGKVAYLTFDDGPTSDNTPKILDILQKENIKATFFIVGSMAEKNPSLLKREKDEGHVLANHSYSHDYKYLYANTSNFTADLKKADDVITSIVGEHNHTLIRFPGGAFNAENRKPFVAASKAAGYHHVDWNCLNGDAEAQHRSSVQLVNRLKETVAGQKNLTILMHDAPGKETTVQALLEIIQYLKASGYEFKTLQ